MFPVQQVIFQKATIQVKYFYKNFQVTKNLETKSSTTFYCASLLVISTKAPFSTSSFFSICWTTTVIKR